MESMGEADCPIDLMDVLKEHPDANVVEPDTDDEAVVCVDRQLFDSLQREAANVRRSVSDGRDIARDAFDRARCPLCPFRSFAGQGRHGLRALAKHVDRYHLPGETGGVRLSAFTPAGTKHEKVLRALWDSDRSAAREGNGLLARAAELLSGGSSDESLCKVNNIEKRVVLVMTVSGPAYRLQEEVIGHASFRRCGYLYYDRAWAAQFLQEAVLAHGRVRPVRARLLHTYLRGGE